MTDQTDTTPVEDTPRAARVAKPKWSDAQIVRCSANKSEDSAPFVLLSVLVASNTAASTIDLALRAPKGTTLDYLRDGKPQEFPEGCLDDAAADALVWHMVRLKRAGALTPRGPTLEGVLAAMMAPES
jgi:hypothetical protein